MMTPSGKHQNDLLKRNLKLSINYVEVQFENNLADLEPIYQLLEKSNNKYNDSIIMAIKEDKRANFKKIIVIMKFEDCQLKISFFILKNVINF